LNRPEPISAPVAAQVHDGLANRQRLMAFSTLAMAITMAVLDGNIVTIALPTMARQFAVAPESAIWIVNAFQLAVTVSLLPLAALGDMFGYRRVYWWGLAVFTVASLACALAPTFAALTFARLVQGLGAAGIMSVNIALIRFIYPHSKLGQGVGNMAVVVAVASAASPSVAAAILSVASWHWLFLVNVPIGVLALAMAARTLPATPRAAGRLDLISVVLNALAFGLNPDSVYLWTLPMFHCCGWTHTWAVTAAGGTHVCLRRVDPARIFPAIRDHRVTHLCGAPIVLNLLVHAPPEVKLRFEHRVEVGTGGAAPPSVIIEAMEKSRREMRMQGGTQMMQQAGMAGRVPRRAQHDHRAVTEYVLVGGHRLDLAVAFDPIRERREVHACGRLRAGYRIPVALADQERRLRERTDLAGVIGVIMADADKCNLLGLELDLRQLIDHANLRRHIGSGHGMTGIPQQILVAVLDEIATVNELKFQIAIRIGVRETLVDGRGRLRRAAIQTRERHVRRCLRRGLQAGERTGARTSRQQDRNSPHCSLPVLSNKYVCGADVACSIRPGQRGWQSHLVLEIALARRRLIT